MAQSNIWGSTQLPDFMGQVMQAATWDLKMRMQREGQVRNILREANPIKFMRYQNQNDQVTRLEELNQTITTLARERYGRFTSQDMMDIGFMVDEFESWQTEQMATQDMFAKDYTTFMGNLDKLKLDEGLAAIENYKETGEYKMGDMVKIRPKNPLEFVANYRMDGRRKPIDISEKFYQAEDGSQYNTIKETWATPEERETIWLTNYINDDALKQGVKEFWEDGLSLSEQKLWVEQMDKYNNTKKPNEPTIDNVELFFGLKFFAPQIMKNTSKTDAYKPTKDKVWDKPTLAVIEGGTPQNLTRDFLIDGKLIEVNYGDFETYDIKNFKVGKDLDFGKKTFISRTDEDIGWFGKPAQEAIGEDGKSLLGKSGKVQEMFVMNDFPVYTGDGETFDNTFQYTTEREKGLGRLIRGAEKQNRGKMDLYKYQPLSQSHLNSIKATFEDDQDGYDEWRRKNVEYSPVAKMILSGGFEVLQIFDQPLADFMGITNPEFVLKRKLKTEDDENKEDDTGKIIKYKVGDKVYAIPKEVEDQFLIDNPNASKIK